VWVVLALGILIALAALVLSIPVDLNARVEVHGSAVASLRVEWLFGRVGKDFRSGEGGGEADEAPREGKKKRPKKKAGEAGEGRKSARSGARLAWQLLRTPGLVRSVLRLIARLVRCVRVRLVAVDFGLDLGDPADTAMLVGAASQAALFADLWSPYHFRLMPMFQGEVMADGEGSLWVRVRPICAIPPVLAFVFAPSTARTVVRVIRWRMSRNG